MLKLILLFFLLAHFTLSASITVPPPLESGGAVTKNDTSYYKYKDEANDVEVIFTKNNLKFARHTASIEPSIHHWYRHFYGWELDETLFVGLISSKSQVANGFSTQSPNNRQINYLGGVQVIDYFCSTSWLDTLLYHETAHNYQLNVKGSIVSRTLHKVFGNGAVLSILPITIPNYTENSFMLEGNAVLNESWHGNGGRLYSGRFKIQTILQAKAGNIVAGDVYNTKLAFPYGEIVYIQGGFYNLYMAKKYGMKAINDYFLKHSNYWFWSFLTNKSMIDATGVSFEKSLDDFTTHYAKLGEEVELVEGETLASSQSFYKLSSDKDELFFLTNESGVRALELVTINKKTKKKMTKRAGWLGGKVLKKDDKYLTQGSRYTSTTEITQGLYDNEAIIQEETSSKMIQGYLSDGRAIYFDVVSSFLQPQLFVGDEFYAQVNSSIITDQDDNIYYFKQDKKDRTLYKNKTPLYTYKGFYGVLSDVDSKGNIYFIANSKLGSTLYRYSDGLVTRASKADNIIDAKLLDDKEVLLVAMSHKDYYYVKNTLESLDDSPYNTKLFFEDKDYYAQTKPLKDIPTLDTNTTYNSVLDMHYSGTNLFVGGGVDGGVLATLNINFGDPLSQNTANIFLNRDDLNMTIAGAGYSNSQFLINFDIAGYSVLDDDDREDARQSGVILNATLPYYKKGYYSGEISTSFYQDYIAFKREPLSVQVDFTRSEHYGYSMYANYLNRLAIYGARERDDNIYGASYSFRHDMPYQFYLSFNAKHSATDADLSTVEAYTNSRGVKLSSIAYQTDMDPTTIVMPTLNANAYLKSASYVDIGLAKVFNFSSYWFTFPISLQRESIFIKYRHYELEEFKSTQKLKPNETTIGITLDMVFVNNLVFPLTIEYTNNDLFQDSDNVSVKINSAF